MTIFMGVAPCLTRAYAKHFLRVEALPEFPADHLNGGDAKQNRVCACVTILALKGSNMARNTHKGVGRAVSLTKNDLWYFDQLPPSARQALANAEHDWSSGAIYNAWKRAARGFKTGQQCAERVQEWDRKTRKRK